MRPFQRTFPFRLALPALIWLIAVVPLGAGVWLLARHEDAAEQLQFEQMVSQVAQSLTLRLRQCDAKMLALASTLAGSGDVEEALWQQTQQRLLLGDASGCEGTVVYMPLLARSQVAAHEATQTARLGTPYKVRPFTERDWYTPITLVAPESSYNLRMLGLDPWRDARRRGALEQARDSGRTVATNRVDLALMNDPAHVVVLQTAVYRPGFPLETIEQRRAAVFGFVGQPLRIDEVVATTAAGHDGLSLQLLDPTEAATHGAPPSGHHLEQRVSFGGRDWVLRATHTDHAQWVGTWRASLVLLIAGLVLASLASVASALLLRQRARAYGLARRFSRKARSHAAGLRAVLDGMRDGVIQLDTRGNILATNRAAEMLLGRNDLVGQSAEVLFDPIDRERAIERFRSAILSGRQGRTLPPEEFALRHADGRMLPMRGSISRTLVNGAETMVWLAGDLSVEHALRAQAAQAERLNALVLDAVPIALLLVDNLGVITRCNPASHALLGWSEDELVGTGMDRLHDPDELQQHLAITQANQLPSAARPDLFRSRRNDSGRLVETEWTMRRRDDSRVPVAMLAVPVNASMSTDDTHRADSTLVVMTDISERKRAMAQIERLAMHDSLTGLPNRLQLEERAQRALQHARAQGKGLALVLLDLDRFKQINDTLGHPVGDLLLQTVAHRLAESVRSGDTVARMGGDEFVALLVDIDSPAEAMRVAEKLRDAVRGAELMIDGHRLHVTPSIGTAMFPAHGDDLTGLLRQADLAMYRAKAAGRDTALLFDPQKHAADTTRLRLETDLRSAVQHGELRLHYQPIVDTCSGRVMSLEALMRWQHPTLGLVPPGDFITVAEETGAITALGAWALRQACSDLARLRRQWPHLRVAVNVSARQFLGRQLVSTVKDALADAALPGSALELEITESALVESQDHVLDKLAALRALGVNIAIDDFGTGYSSLAYLSNFPVTTLKVDRSFVRQIDSGQGQGTLASAIVSLARNLGLETVGEGVETSAQWSYLREAGCSLVQGFAFSPAVPVDKLPETLARIAELPRPEPMRRLELWQRTGFESSSFG